MTVSARKQATALAVAALAALTVSACDDNGSRTTDPPSETVNPPPEIVSDLIHTATGANGVRSGQPPVPFASGITVSHFAGTLQTVSDPRYVSLHPWHDEQGDLNFSVSMSLGGTAGRFVDTSTSAGTASNEDTHHGLGSDWRSFEIRRDYAGAGTWTINVATDANDTRANEQP